MNKYGYILDNTYQTQSTDVVWPFERYNEDGSITTYSGIETTRNITSEKVVIVGNSEEFNSWVLEYAPPIDI